MKNKKATVLTMLILAVMLFSSCVSSSFSLDPTPTAVSEMEETAKPRSELLETARSLDEELKISYLDVGQADSIFIILPNGETILIDAGEKASSGDIIQYIRDSGKTTLDYVIATHPHADHIGGMAAVLNAFTVNKIYMPDKTHTSKTFENLIDTIEAKGLSINIAAAGRTIFDDGNMKAEFIAPVADHYRDLNNYSAVVMLTYRDCRFLFMGDAEAEAERDILEAGYDVKADVLKVGHHGSKTSSTAGFIEEVAPKYAVISCMENNKYGHPDADILALLDQFNADVYRTDTDGTVVVTCDGEK